MTLPWCHRFLDGLTGVVCDARNAVDATAMLSTVIRTFIDVYVVAEHLVVSVVQKRGDAL